MSATAKNDGPSSSTERLPAMTDIDEIESIEDGEEKHGMSTVEEGVTVAEEDGVSNERGYTGVENVENVESEKSEKSDRGDMEGEKESKEEEESKGVVRCWDAPEEALACALPLSRSGSEEDDATTDAANSGDESDDQRDGGSGGGVEAVEEGGERCGGDGGDGEGGAGGHDEETDARDREGEDGTGAESAKREGEEEGGESEEKEEKEEGGEKEGEGKGESGGGASAKGGEEESATGVKMGRATAPPTLIAAPSTLLELVRDPLVRNALTVLNTCELDAATESGIVLLTSSDGRFAILSSGVALATHVGRGTVVERRQPIVVRRMETPVASTHDFLQFWLLVHTCDVLPITSIESWMRMTDVLIASRASHWLCKVHVEAVVAMLRRSTLPSDTMLLIRRAVDRLHDTSPTELSDVRRAAHKMLIPCTSSHPRVFPIPNGWRTFQVRAGNDYAAAALLAMDMFDNAYVTACGDYFTVVAPQSIIDRMRASDDAAVFFATACAAPPNGVVVQRATRSRFTILGVAEMCAEPDVHLGIAEAVHEIVAVIRSVCIAYIECRNAAGDAVEHDTNEAACRRLRDVIGHSPNGTDVDDGTVASLVRICSDALGHLLKNASPRVASAKFVRQQCDRLDVCVRAAQGV